MKISNYFKPVDYIEELTPEEEEKRDYLSYLRQNLQDLEERLHKECFRLRLIFYNFHHYYTKMFHSSSCIWVGEPHIVERSELVSLLLVEDNGVHAFLYSDDYILSAAYPYYKQAPYETLSTLILIPRYFQDQVKALGLYRAAKDFVTATTDNAGITIRLNYIIYLAPDILYALDEKQDLPIDCLQKIPDDKVSDLISWSGAYKEAIVAAAFTEDFERKLEQNVIPHINSFCEHLGCDDYFEICFYAKGNDSFIPEDGDILKLYSWRFYNGGRR